jgi:hypothetical protein
MSEQLPVVEFEGFKIKPQRGVYRCPFNCGDPRYPRPKWKTVKGFMRHLQGCSQSPAKIEARRKAQKEREEKLYGKAQQLIEESGLHIGDTIFCVYEIITKPVRDSRGRKVRYEPEKRFRARQEVIESIEARYGTICVNQKIQKRILPTMEEAEESARQLQHKWDEYVAFSRSCR